MCRWGGPHVRVVATHGADVLPRVGRRARTQPLPHPAALAHVAAERLDRRSERHAYEGHDGRQHKRHHLRRLEEHVERRRLAAVSITVTTTAEPLATAAAAAAPAAPAAPAAAHADAESRRARPRLQRTHRRVEIRATCIKQETQPGSSVCALLFPSCERSADPIERACERVCCRPLQGFHWLPGDVNLDEQVTAGRSSNDYRMESGQQGHEEVAWKEYHHALASRSVARRLGRGVEFANKHLVKKHSGVYPSNTLVRMSPASRSVARRLGRSRI